MFEKCVLITILQLNSNQRFGDKETKLKICHHMPTSSTQLQHRSFHVVERTKTSSKYPKMRAKVLLLIVKYANLWGFTCRVVVSFLQTQRSGNDTQHEHAQNPLP